MRFRFADRKLEAFYSNGKWKKKFRAVEKDLFTVLDDLEAASDVRDLYNLKGLHFEKLSARARDEHSLRLNDQFRLIVRIERDSAGLYIVIEGIEDYH